MRTRTVKRLGFLITFFMLICLAVTCVTAFAEDGDTKPDLWSKVQELTFADAEDDSKTYPLMREQDGSLYMEMPGAKGDNIVAKGVSVSSTDNIWVIVPTKVAVIITDNIIQLSDSEWSKVLGLTWGNGNKEEFTICIGPDKPKLKKVGNGRVADIPDTDTAYTVKKKILPDLKALSISDNDTMIPEFTFDHYEYYASVAPDKEEVTINASATLQGLLAEPVIKYNGSNSQSIPVAWDSDGKMDVVVNLKNNYGSCDYTIHLTREKLEDKPEFALQPQDAEYYGYGINAPVLKVRATASGEVTYQWYRAQSDSAENGEPIEGATASSYQPDKIEGNEEEVKEYYFCRAANVKEGTTYTTDSRIVAVTVFPSPYPYDVTLTKVDGSSIPAEGFTYLEGDEGAEIKVSAKSLVNNGKWSYIWAYTNNKNREEKLQSGTNNTFTIPTDWDYNFPIYCRATYRVDGYDYATTSSEIPVTVNATKAPAFRETLALVSQTYVNGATEITRLNFRGESLERYGNSLQYSWQTSEDGETYTDIPGESNSSSGDSLNIAYTPDVSEGKHYYRVKVNNTFTSITTGTEYTAETFYSTPAVIEFKEAAEFDGEGTKDKPYRLNDANDLEDLNFMTAGGNSYKDKFFFITNDIVLPENWTPIGTENSTFSGNIDGGNHLLTVPEGGKCLLGYVRDAALSNLNIYGKQIDGYGVVENYVVDYKTTEPIVIDNVTLKSGSKTLMSGFIGGYASGQDAVMLRNCTIEEGVVVGYDKQQSNIGGFAGEYNGYMFNCVSHAKVYGVNFVGGVVADKGQTMGPFEIKNCVFDGEVVATGNYVGGICGAGYAGTLWGIDSAPATPCATIQNCFSSGKISGADRVGGIFGGEPGVWGCWDNGIGYVQNNLFVGQVEATDGSYVGGVIGYLNSIDKNNIISNNYYAGSCGAQKGIGFIHGIFTDYNSPYDEDPSIVYVTESTYVRHDDPAGADADKLAKAVSADELKDGTVTALLNKGENSFGNWEQNENYPMITDEPVAYKLTISGDYKKTYYIGEEFDPDGMEFTALWTDGKETKPSLDEVSISGFDSSEKQFITMTAMYNAAKAEFELKIIQEPKYPNEKIYVTFSLYGDTVHTDQEVTHAYKDGDLIEWIEPTEYELPYDSTVEDLFRLAMTDKGLAFTGNTQQFDSLYISGIQIPGTDPAEYLSEFTNGTNSGWLYMVNEIHPHFGVSKTLLNDGDEVVIHYTDDYKYDDPFNEENADNIAAKSAQKKVDALPAPDEIKLEDEDIVNEAKAAYEGLTPEGKNVFGKAYKKKLDDAIEALENAQAGAAQAVDDAIAALPDADEIKAGDKEQVEAVRDMYDKLPESVKDLVEKLDTLRLAEKTIEKIEVDEQLETVNNDLNDANKTIAALTARAETAEAAVNDAQKALDEAIASGEKSEEEIRKLKKELDDKKNELATATQALETARSEKAALETQLGDKQGELDKMTGEIENLKGQINSASADAQKSQSEIQEALTVIKIQNKTVKKVKVKGKKKKAKISWKKTGKGYKYEVYVSKKLSKGFKKKASTTKTKAVVKKLKSKKTYYVKVRAFKVVGKKKVYTQYSEVMKVKVK